ncbi:MAG TPA: CehA/McbA family metallohydrolase [Brevefilum sp.]|nr:CehA/McbA family metallohydrolase [Brevefilum sp.]HOR19358.1 CehA/McbA family metallohydrolase [Brevefilum sp.]HPL69769.1 CehA/McbA family metallohydrolase [Brevefilum sp.]
MNETRFSIHIHTNYSDGNASHTELVKIAAKAGLHGIITTDHNIWLDGLDGYYGEGKHKVMLLVGEEIHNRKLKPPGNHLLAINARKEMSIYGDSPQRLIDQIQRSDGLSFLAHPIEDPLEMFNEKEFSWRDWDIHGFTGIELWNQMSEFKSVTTGLFSALMNALFPKQMTQGPLERTLALWDQLIATQMRKIVAIGGVDAHKIPKKLGPFTIHLYPYLHHFKSVTTHIINPRPLSGSFPDDRNMVMQSLSQGHCFVAYDLPAPTEGFKFLANNEDDQFMMGDTVKIQNGLTFQIRLPRRVLCRLLKDGKIIKEWADRDINTYITTEPGVYRVEAFIPYKGKMRGWIFSNPIYAWR